MDILEADLALLERSARAISALRVKVVDGEGFLNLHFADVSVVHSWNPLMFSSDTLDLAVMRRLTIQIGEKDTYAMTSDRRSASEQHGDDAGQAITCAAGKVAQ